MIFFNGVGVGVDGVGVGVAGIGIVDWAASAGID
jgi:hypothetical protein